MNPLKKFNLSSLKERALGLNLIPTWEILAANITITKPTTTGASVIAKNIYHSVAKLDIIASLLGKVSNESNIETVNDLILPPINPWNK